jgi:hypothetical protein
MTKIKKRTFAIPAAARAIPVNPRIAAINATTKKINAQRNMIKSLLIAKDQEPMPALTVSSRVKM